MGDGYLSHPEVLTLADRVRGSVLMKRIHDFTRHLSRVSVAAVKAPQVRCLGGLLHERGGVLCLLDDTGSVPLILHPEVLRLHANKFRSGAGVILRFPSVYGSPPWVVVTPKSLIGLL